MGMQNCAFAGGAATLAGSAYWYKKYRDRKKAEATVAGKIKSKVGKKGYYAVCAVAVTAVGGALLAFFSRDTYMTIFKKLPECLQFSFLNLDEEKKDKKKPTEGEEKKTPSESPASQEKPEYEFTEKHGEWPEG